MKDVARSPDGIPIHFDVAGSGQPAVVFVHGWSCDRTYWDAQMRALADRYRVVAIDLAGHGESGTGRSSWTMPAFGGDVVAVVERLGLERVVLVGHSMGGDVIMEAAASLGDRVEALVWVDVYRRLAEPDSLEAIEAFIEPFRRDFVGEAQRFVRGMFPSNADPDLVDRVANDMSSAPPAIALDEMKHAMSNEGPVLARLAESRVPVTAINPDYRPTDLGSLREHGVRTVVMPNVGHFLMMEDPAGFDRLLEDIIQDFSRRRPVLRGRGRRGRAGEGARGRRGGRSPRSGRPRR